MFKKTITLCVCACTWVEQDDGSKAAQLRFIHLHVPHLAYKFCQNSAERWRGEHIWRFKFRTEATKCEMTTERKEDNGKKIRGTNRRRTDVDEHIPDLQSLPKLRIWGSNSLMHGWAAGDGIWTSWKSAATTWGSGGGIQYQTPSNHPINLSGVTCNDHPTLQVTGTQTAATADGTSPSLVCVPSQRRWCC